eukprot:366393-Chlamydomonas_euryale.AAC.10
MPVAAAAAAGSLTVTEAEVCAILVEAPGGTSAGPDGLPYEAWRVCNGIGAGLLARVFTAMVREDRHLPGFNDGTITPLPKPGAPD